MNALSKWAILVPGVLLVPACVVFDEATDPDGPTPTATPSSTPTPTATPTASATPVSAVEERFHQGYSGAKADVLLVVDNSGSMGTSQGELANDVPSLMSGFVALDLDFHVGVITTDTVDSQHSGRLQGTPAFLERDTPNLIPVLQSRVQVGTTGSPLERGLLASQLALSPPLTDAGNTNAGFLRDDAVLSILYFTDENDSSEGTAADYVTFLEGLKADPSKIHVSAIADSSGQCNMTADETRYGVVASSFNGVIADICTDDFALPLQDMSDEIAALATGFPLQYIPVAETIEVTIDGVVSTGGIASWSYNQVSNEIVFASGAIPDACSDVTIGYSLAPGQDVTEPEVVHPPDPACP